MEDHAVGQRDLRDQRDLRRLLDATPMAESVEVRDRPRIKKQTLIAQARFTRSQIMQMFPSRLGVFAVNDALVQTTAAAVV